MYIATLAFLLACADGPTNLPSQQVASIATLPQTTAEVTRIYFIHNAESDYSVKDAEGTKFTSGRSPEVHLNGRGQEQAERLAELLSPRIGEALVFLPPAVRAKETAAPLISDTIAIGQTYDELFEVSMGEWEGKPKDQAYKNEYQKWAHLSAHDKYTTPKVTGGESYQEAADRAILALKHILQSHPGKTILVISGENLLNALALRWMHPALSQIPGTKLPLLPMEKGDFFLVEIPQHHSVEQASVSTLFHIQI